MRRSPSLDDLFLQANNPAEFARSALGFFPDPLQESVLRSRHPRRLLCCSRQWGKSTTAAALAIHRLRFSLPGSTVLLLAPTHRQSAELLARMKSFARRLGFRLRGDGHNQCSIRMPNGSRAIALPGSGKTTRTFSADLLIFDEASRIDDDVYYSLRPATLARRGSILALSTPAGPTGFFWDAWERGGDEWDRFRVPAPQCARFSESALARERKALGEWWYRQEFLCEFVTSGTGFFPQAKLDTMFEDLEPL